MKNDHSFYKAAAALAVLVALAVTSFTWPAANLAPRDLPIGTVGAAAVPAGVEGHRFADEAAARDAIRNREVYGAVAPGRLLVASAASPAVAQRLRLAAPGAAVEDVVPEPAGMALGSLVLPLTLVGVAMGILGFLLFAGRQRLAWLLLAASGAGLLVVGIAQGAFGALAGDWAVNAGVVTLALLAVGAAVTGLASSLGRPGIGIAAGLMVLVGNPWSGVTSAPELLPEPAGTLGQLLPPGAAGSLLRSVAYFDGAAAAAPLVVLAVWALAGLALVVRAGYAARASSQPVMSSITR